MTTTTSQSSTSHQWIFDSQVAQDYMRCERKCYFHFIKETRPPTFSWRGWRYDTEQPALVFGLAWHQGMDLLWSILTEPNRPKFSVDDLTAGCLNAFIKEWDSYGLDHQHYHPRSPGKAMELFREYIIQKAKVIQTFEVIGIEVPFSVLLDSHADVIWHGRMDKVVRNPIYEGIVTYDHKTTSSFSRFNWANSFSPNVQVDGYNHAGHSTYGDDFKGTIIDGVQVQKTAKINECFMEVPVIRQYEQMDAWLWETRMTIKDFLEDWQRLVDFRTDPSHKDRARFLPAFKKRTTACSDFGGCEYQTLCKARANPESWDEPPKGYVRNEWNPLEVRG